MLTVNELTRYKRQIIIDCFGKTGQEKLRKAKVFVAGLGGLGSPITIYLAAAGVGTLRVIDKDNVQLSNLNRQILYGDDDIGKPKARIAKEKLESLNINTKIEAIVAAITDENASDLISDSDLIVDALDNYKTRYILNKISVRQHKPLFFGAIQGFYGMATTIIPGKTPCLRCFAPNTPPPSVSPVLGVTAAIIGCIEATEVIKYIVGFGQLLTGRLLYVDNFRFKSHEVSIKKQPLCPECGTI